MDILKIVSVVCLGITVGAPARADADVEIRGVRLDAAPLEILTEILETAGLRSARVTSYRRTARKQAELMYAICARKRGITKARRTYSAAAERIINIYVKYRKTKKRAQIIDLMTAETKKVLAELGPGRTTLMHVDSDNHTFDVAPSSIRNKKRFTAAIKAHPDVIRLLEPGVGSERAFHLEVSRALHAITGAWTGTCSRGAAPVPIELRIKRMNKRYVGTMTANDSAVRWNLDIDRKHKTIALIRPGEFLTGQFEDDYSALTFDRGGLGCQLEKLALPASGSR